MVLSDQACKELAQTISELSELIPENPLIARQLRLFKKNIEVAIMKKRDRIEENFLQPLHYWMHLQSIEAVERKAETIQDAIKEISKKEVDDASKNKSN